MRPLHLVILIIVLILLFGASKLPDLARNLGKSAKILKSELQDLQNESPAASALTEKNPTTSTGEPVTHQKSVKDSEDCVENRSNVTNTDLNRS